MLDFIQDFYLDLIVSVPKIGTGVTEEDPEDPEYFPEAEEEAEDFKGHTNTPLFTYSHLKRSARPVPTIYNLLAPIHETMPCFTTLR